jgi:hypothetical protein
MKHYRIIRVSNGKQGVYYVEKRKPFLYIFGKWRKISSCTHSVIASAEMEIQRDSKTGFILRTISELKAY